MHSALEKTMAITLSKGFRFGRLNQFGPVSEAARWASDFNQVAKRLQFKRLPSTKWRLRCSSGDSDEVENPLDAIPSYYWGWKEDTRDNFREILTEQDLVETLQNAGNKLVVVQFHSPHRVGCWRLRPKMYQIAEEHPDVIFVNVNYEVHKQLCCNLAVVVLPFFQFYRNAQGRICSFSCTLNTIYKMENALKKHGHEQSGLKSGGGLDELLAFGSLN